MSIQKQNALVIGAGSAIGKAVIEGLLEDESRGQVAAVSRQPVVVATAEPGGRLQTLRSDYSEESMAETVQRLRQTAGSFSRLFICNGLLHDESMRPEKRLQDLSAEALQSVFRVNTVIPLLWLKHLKVLLPRRESAVVTVFSARVGSIEDNRKGGWYAYRASKAALNMGLKSAAIELARKHKGLRILAFHPGTTDTPLSQPFQDSVPGDKLFTPRFVADRLLRLSAALPGEEVIEFRDWDGKTVAW